MKKLLLNLFFVAAIAGTIFISSCSEEDEDEAAIPTGWTETQKDAFISECTSGADAGTTEQCECLFNGIANEWTYDQYENDLELDDLGTLFEIAAGCGAS